jgi:Uma2 family endonuclease
MSFTATGQAITADQYYAISTEGDRQQLVEGGLIVNDPKPIHAVLQARLFVALQAWTEASEDRGLPLLPTDLRIDEHNVFAPDLMWFAESRRPDDLTQYPSHLPDLCVEIRSPGTWRYDIGAKKGVYERVGLPELWLVDDMGKSVLAFRRSAADAKSFDVAAELAGDGVLESPLLPGFALRLDALFDV